MLDMPRSNTVPSTQPARRLVLKLMAVAPAALATAAPKKVRIAEFDAAGARTGIVEVEKVQKSPGEWKKQLTPGQFAVARQADTEPPGTGQYAYNHADGLYRCICCDTALFDS